MTIDRLEQIGIEISTRVEKLDKLGAKAVDQVASIDHLLAEAEKLCATREIFEAFKQKHCPDLSRSRTYELLAIKEGRKTLEEIRTATRARVAKHRAVKKTDGVAEKDSVTATVIIGGTPEASAEKRQADEERKHSQSAMLIHADSAFDLAQRLRAAYQRNPTAITAKTIETVRRTAEAWTMLEADLSAETIAISKAAA